MRVWVVPVNYDACLEDISTGIQLLSRFKHKQVGESEICIVGQINDHLLKLFDSLFPDVNISIRKKVDLIFAPFKTVVIIRTRGLLAKVKAFRPDYTVFWAPLGGGSFKCSGRSVNPLKRHKPSAADYVIFDVRFLYAAQFQGDVSYQEPVIVNDPVTFFRKNGYVDFVLEYLRGYYQLNQFTRYCLLSLTNSSDYEDEQLVLANIQTALNYSQNNDLECVVSIHPFEKNVNLYPRELRRIHDPVALLCAETILATDVSTIALSAARNEKPIILLPYAGRPSRELFSETMFEDILELT